jgi:tetratricopeptide (TPR) repeat protein
MMQRRPWKLWSKDGVPAEGTNEVRALLERSLKRWPDHQALCHLYIHAMEAGPDFAQAIAAAETLEANSRGLGHLVHMPSHIYIWTGRYDDAVRINQNAVHVDDTYADYAGRMNFYTLYRLHNYHFIAYGCMFEGRRELALQASRAILRELPRELLAKFADFLDVFMATPYHVMVRFGMWDEILAEPAPEQSPDLAATLAVWHYARGIAHASKGNVGAAKGELEAFLLARSRVSDVRMMFNNPVQNILAVGEDVLKGEIAYREGDYDAAFRSLRDAVEKDDSLNYDEPWGWMEPVRHALGALLTEQGRYADAEAVYRRDLERFPENGWALHGLEECLRNLGRTEEADAVHQRFLSAWKRADVAIPGSCFCKTR